MFQTLAQHFVCFEKIFRDETLAVGGIDNHQGSVGVLLEVFDVAALNLDAVGHHGRLYVAARTTDHAAVDVVTVYFVEEFFFFGVVLVYAAEKLAIEVAPFLERKLFAEDTGSNVAGDEGCLDGQCSRATHGVDKVTLPAPAREHDESGSKNLVDGGCTCLDSVSAAVQRLAGTVECQSTLLLGNVDVEHKVGVVDAHRRTLLVLLVEVIGNGVFHAVGNELRVAEDIAVNNGINRECCAPIHILVPIHGLYLLVNLVGIGCLETYDGFENAHRSAETEVGSVHHLFVSCERDHATAYLHIVGTKPYQFLGEHLFETLKGLRNQFKFLHITQ